MKRFYLIAVVLFCWAGIASSESGKLLRVGIDQGDCTYDYFNDDWHDLFGNACDPQSGGGGGGGGGTTPTQSCTAACSGDCHGLGGGCSCGSPQTGCNCAGGGCSGYACCGIWNGARTCSSGSCDASGISSIRSGFIPAAWKNRCAAAKNFNWQETVFDENATQAGIEVRTENDAVPVQISDVKYEAIPGGFKNLSYRIKNKADKKIVAIEVWVEVSDGANLNRTPQYMDWWAHEELGLPPSGKAPGPQGLWMAVKGGGVRSISISVGAVVFADGTMVGDNAGDFRKFLMGEHLAVISQAVTVGNASKGKNLEAIRGILGEPVESVSQRQANVLLNEALAKGGTQGLQNEVRRLAALQP